jgi:hypothetical protein
MSLDSFLYLLEIYWPFLLAAFAIGIGTGWFSLGSKKATAVAAKPAERA